ALAAGATRLVVAAPLTGMFSDSHRGPSGPIVGGLGGLLKSLAREWPERNVRVVHVSPESASTALAQQLVSELSGDDREPEVIYEEDMRKTPHLVNAPLNGAS